MHRLTLPFILTTAILVGSAVVARAADEEIASVKGVVTYKGKPLETGRIFFYFDKDQFVGANIKEGKYTVTKVSVGAHKIAIEGKDVPARYNSEERSGLQVTTARGEFTYDVSIR